MKCDETQCNAMEWNRMALNAVEPDSDLGKQSCFVEPKLDKVGPVKTRCQAERVVKYRCDYLG